MYKTIYIPVDNSDHSNVAVDLGVKLAQEFGSKIVGSHVYAAKMHDKRFKQMEAGLPEEYHDEKELDRQRKIHDSLITRGLQIITDSYLDYVDKKCTESNLPLERRSLEGRNWKVLAEDINTNAYDLTIMGSLGVGAVKDSVIGSNTERVPAPRAQFGHVYREGPEAHERGENRRGRGRQPVQLRRPENRACHGESLEQAGRGHFRL